MLLLTQAGVRPASIDSSRHADLILADVLAKCRNQNRLRPLLRALAEVGDAAVTTRVEELVTAELATRAIATDERWRLVVPYGGHVTAQIGDAAEIRNQGVLIERAAAVLRASWGRK